jgi:hypothetical protein
LPGFGKLVKQKSKARTGFNPKTQQKIKIPAKTVVKFRVAKAAKDGVLGVKKLVKELRPVKPYAFGTERLHHYMELQDRFFKFQKYG